MLLFLVADSGKTAHCEDETRHVAEPEMQRLAHGNESFNFFLAISQPETLSCSPVKIMGFKKDIGKKNGSLIV